MALVDADGALAVRYAKPSKGRYFRKPNLSGGEIDTAQCRFDEMKATLTDPIELAYGNGWARECSSAAVSRPRSSPPIWVCRCRPFTAPNAAWSRASVNIVTIILEVIMDAREAGQALMICTLAFWEQLGEQKLRDAGRQLRYALTDPRITPGAARTLEGIVHGIELECEPAA